MIARGGQADRIRKKRKIESAEKISWCREKNQISILGALRAVNPYTMAT